MFSAHGDRTNRNKARMKYVLDAMGFDKYLALVEEKLGAKLDARAAPKRLRRARSSTAPRISACTRRSRTGLNWIGVVLPVGKLTCEQMRGLATIAQRSRRRRYPSHRLAEPADLRRAGRDKVATAEAAIETLGLTTKASSIRAGLVACTGNAGCRFAASDTKRHAEDIARWCEARVELDGPVNIHLTGCHHSCAQHYIGDIGLIACKVPVDETATPSRAITSWSAAASGPEAALARELYQAT